MTFDPTGYALTSDDGEHLWFLDARMSVRAGGEQTGGAFTVIEWSAPAGFGPPRHIHHAEDEAFYVIDGQMLVECGERRWTVGPGGFVFLPKAVPHAFLVTEGPVRGLVITSPSGFERYIGELGRPAERAGLPTPSAPDVPRLLDAAPRHGHAIVGPPLSLPSVEVS